nr:hypothetical protein CFP56_55291 [Quercus suber]
MDETNKVREKIKELSEALRVEKMLVIQKDEEIQAALLKTDAERKNEEAIAIAVGRKDAAVAEEVDLDQRDETVAPSI